MCVVEVYDSTHLSNLWITIDRNLTVLFEDNTTCVAQMKEGYIKSERTKHIPSKFFSFIQELEKDKGINIQYIRSSDNVTDLFTKALPTTTSYSWYRDVSSVRFMKKNYSCQLKGELTWLHSFFYYGFVPLDFPDKILTRQYRTRIEEWCTLFSFAVILFHWVFPRLVLPLDRWDNRLGPHLMEGPQFTNKIPHI